MRFADEQEISKTSTRSPAAVFVSQARLPRGYSAMMENSSTLNPAQTFSPHSFNTVQPRSQTPAGRVLLHNQINTLTNEQIESPGHAHIPWLPLVRRQN